MSTIISIISLIIAITIHEFSHALMADHLGDPTPRSQDRLSLNPLKHLDPLGTFMLIFAKFGWGKPVPIDPYNLKNPRRDELLIALAGPASNIILAILVSILSRFLPIPLLISYILIATNLSLAIFNLLPIPPLDGSKIFLNLLPYQQSLQRQSALNQYGNFILIAMLFLPFHGSNMINIIIGPIIQLLLKLLI
ncbi:site-2 protease family protein [Candidatus Shapirobacteria bacterium]|nr:MAG: site-2 protease family protein [Candidatus Shapirobacteria bacterium]